MNIYIRELQKELKKDDITTIDITKCLKLVDDIDTEIYDLEHENSDYEDEISELENDLYELKDELSSHVKKQDTLDDTFRNEIFNELSKKYSYYKLESILKENNIL